MSVSNHICPYHAHHAACDHAYPVQRSVLCTPNPSFLILILLFSEFQANMRKNKLLNSLNNSTDTNTAKLASTKRPPGNWG